MKRRELERHLRADGAELLREGARHSVWAIGGPESERIAAVPRHNEIKTGTVRGICKELDISQSLPAAEAAGSLRPAGAAQIARCLRTVDPLVASMQAWLSFPAARRERPPTTPVYRVGTISTAGGLDLPRFDDT